MITALRAVAARGLPYPADTVFAAWLDSAQLGTWMFAGDHVVNLRAEPVVGGAFTFVVRRDGEVLHHEGRYRPAGQACHARLPRRPAPQHRGDPESPGTGRRPEVTGR